LLVSQHIVPESWNPPSVLHSEHSIFPPSNAHNVQPIGQSVQPPFPSGNWLLLVSQQVVPESWNPNPVLHA
jgi:hypothetical protein